MGSRNGDKRMWGHCVFTKRRDRISAVKLRVIYCKLDKGIICFSPLQIVLVLLIAPLLALKSLWVLSSPMTVV